MIAHTRDQLKRARDATQDSPRSGFTVIEVFVVIAVIVLLVALFLPAVRTAPNAGRRTQCKNHLKQIGLALFNYHDVYGTFPPAYTVDADGKPLHSWRTLILPWLDQAPLYNQINLSKPWDDPANTAAFQTPLDAFSCPSAASPKGQSSYLAVVTPNSCLRPLESQTIPQIKDGASTTLLVIEVAPENAVPWMSPQDADENLLLGYGPKTKDAHTGGRHALMADGAVRFLSHNLPANTMQALISVAGGETIGEF